MSSSTTQICVLLVEKKKEFMSIEYEGNRRSAENADGEELVETSAAPEELSRKIIGGADRPLDVGSHDNAASLDDADLDQINSLGEQWAQRRNAETRRSWSRQNNDRIQAYKDYVYGPCPGDADSAAVGHVVDGRQAEECAETAADVVGGVAQETEVGEGPLTEQQVHERIVDLMFSDGAADTGYLVVIDDNTGVVVNVDAFDNPPLSF